MPYSYHSCNTLDDLMRSVIEEIIAQGEEIRPSRGKAKELRSVLLELKNPRARLSRTETRGKALSCLGELCWYLAKSNDLDFISYYLPKYRESADGDMINGAYGPRLFDWKNINQIETTVERLRTRPDTRRAVIQLFEFSDLLATTKNVPCTCTLQFMLRNGSLHMLTNMRSNDAFLGLPHDIFCFTMLQEILARTLSARIGDYSHAVGSLHLYDQNIKSAREFLEEGWQSTTMTMPVMPKGDPWPGIDSLLDAESALRSGNYLDEAIMSDLDPYWADLIRLLQLLRYRKDKNVELIASLRSRMAFDVYRVFIETKLRQLQ